MRGEGEKGGLVPCMVGCRLQGFAGVCSRKMTVDNAEGAREPIDRVRRVASETRFCTIPAIRSHSSRRAENRYRWRGLGHTEKRLGCAVPGVPQDLVAVFLRKPVVFGCHILIRERSSNQYFGSASCKEHKQQSEAELEKKCCCPM